MSRSKNIAIISLSTLAAFYAVRRFTENRIEKVDYNLGRISFDFSTLITGRILAKLPVQLVSRTGIPVRVGFTGFLFLKQPSGQPMPLTPINIQPFNLPAFGSEQIEINVQITLGSILALVGTGIQQGGNPAQIFQNKIYIDGIFSIGNTRLPIRRNVTILGLSNNN